MNTTTGLLIALGALLLLRPRKAGASPLTPPHGGDSNGTTPNPNPAATAPTIVQPGSLDAQLTNALRSVVQDFGPEVARNVERIYRLETGNFRSEQFLKTGTPGMRAFATGGGLKYPWGWSLSGDGLTAGDFLAPVHMAENAGGPVVPWVAFNSLPKAIHFVGYFLNKYGNRPGRWHNTDNYPTQQAQYAALVAGYPTPLVDNIV